MIIIIAYEQKKKNQNDFKPIHFIQVLSLYKICIHQCLERIPINFFGNADFINNHL